MSNKRAPRVETIFDEYKLRMKQPSQTGGKDATIVPRTHENNPGLRVRTNVDNDKNNGLIDAGMDAITWQTLIVKMEEIAKGPNGERFTVKNFGHPFINGQRSREKKQMSTTSVWKDDAGVCWISVTAGPQRPHIEFKFMSDEYHNFLDKDNNPLSDALVSKYTMLATARMWGSLMANVLEANYDTPQWIIDSRAKFAGGQGGGQNSGGGYQQRPQQQQQQNNNSGGSSSSFDEDIPF